MWLTAHYISIKWKLQSHSGEITVDHATANLSVSLEERVDWWNLQSTHQYSCH